MSAAPDLDRAARSILREELAIFERRILDHLNWLEERLEWISQDLDDGWSPVDGSRVIRRSSGPEEAV